MNATPNIIKSSAVTAVPAAPSADAIAHFAASFTFETDCWDVHDALERGADFVLLDVRGPNLFAAGHVPGAINLPHGKIVASKLKQWPADTLFVTYCAGPHCNGAARGALRLARLGRPVKIMAGGITGWIDEGFALARATDVPPESIASSAFTSPADGVRAIHEAIDLLSAHWNDLPNSPVASASTVPADVRAWANAFDLERGAPLDALVPAVVDGLQRWTVHPTHPRYFGLFNPTPTWPGITADLITAVMNPQLAAYSHAPAAMELEQVCVRLLAGRLGLPETAGGHLTSGGAEANHTAVLTALTAVFPEYAAAGLRALGGQPVFYASADSHLAWIKIAHATGLGRNALRLVPTDSAGRLRVESLREAIAHDLAAGHRPFLVIATAGTTAAGAIDPLSRIADVARDHELRLHVDAAWAGAACLSDRYRSTLAGIERADTVTLDAHKWLSVPMGAGIFFTRRRAELPVTFGVSTTYMPNAIDDAPDPYTTTLQWSRRFSGLKLFLSLATFGVDGYAAEIERNVALGERLRSGVRAAGWRVINDTPFPIVCVTHPAADDLSDDASWAWHSGVAAHVVASGEAWVSPARVSGRPAVRACLTSYRTEAADIDALVVLLERAARDWVSSG